MDVFEVLPDDLCLEIMVLIPTFALRRALGHSCRKWYRAYYKLLAPCNDLLAADYLNLETEEAKNDPCGPLMVQYIPEWRSAEFEFVLGDDRHAFRSFQVISNLRDNCLQIQLNYDVLDSKTPGESHILRASYFSNSGTFLLSSYIGRVPDANNRWGDKNRRRGIVENSSVTDVFDLVMWMRKLYNRQFQFVTLDWDGNTVVMSIDPNGATRTDPLDYPTEEAWKQHLRYDPKLARRIYHFPYFVKERERRDREYVPKKGHVRNFSPASLAMYGKCIQIYEVDPLVAYDDNDDDDHTLPCYKET